MTDSKDKKSEVKVPENVPIDYLFEKMLKTFLKQVDKSGILREVKARRFHIKPSEIKRLAQKARRKE